MYIVIALIAICVLSFLSFIFCLLVCVTTGKERCVTLARWSLGVYVLAGVLLVIGGIVGGVLWLIS